MAIKIKWTKGAEESFETNIAYLQKEWTNKEITKFITQTKNIIDRLSQYPEAYPPGIKNNKYRRARLNKYIVLFYCYYKAKQEIVLITFWNIKQPPQKLQY